MPIPSSLELLSLLSMAVAAGYPALLASPWHIRGVGSGYGRLTFHLD